MADKLDPELDIESGASEDSAGRVVDTEKTGGRHRRRFGYTTEGAAENDHDISQKGRKPLHVTMRASKVPDSRIANFHHGVTTHHVTTVQRIKHPTTI